MLKKRYQLILLAAVILAAYYPAVLAGFSLIDDRGMYAEFSGNADWTLRSIFLPAYAEGLYYRPLLILTFALDSRIHGLSPGLMHLENVLLHLGSAILVFLITSRVLPRNSSATSLPLFAGFLFGLHPVLSESTNWISGRTDLLAGIFVLLSALLIIQYRETRSRGFLIFALLAFLGGVLSKETAMAFLPGIFLLATAKADGYIAHTADSDEVNKRLNVAMIIGGVLILGIFYILRSSAFSSFSHRVAITKAAISNDWLHAMIVFLRTLGFYIKKFFFPYPLNFAIMEIAPVYEILAVPVIAFCLYSSIVRNNIASALLATSLFLLGPALVVALGQIAWTPYAERYMYISSAFAVISLAAFLAQNKMRIPFGYFFAVVILVVMFTSTLHRSIIWADDAALCKDTIEQSPQARDIRATYGGILAGRGEYTAALEQFRIGKSIPFPYYDPRFDIGIGYIHDKQGKLDEAIRDTETAFNKSQGTSSIALQNLIAMLKEKEQQTGDKNKASQMREKIISYQEKLYSLTHDPHIVFIIGNDERERGRRDSAIAYIQRAAGLMNDNDPSKKVALRSIETLRQEKCQ